MSNAKDRFRQVPPPPGGGKSAAMYTRFIPREELSSFAAWKPGSLGGEEEAAAAASAEPQKSAEELQVEALRAARQGGYHDGYRDGLAALESFKQSFAQQATAQMGALVQSYAGRDAVLGIRPEHIGLASDTTRWDCREGFKAVVRVVESAGSEKIVHARVEGHSLVARLDPHTRLKTGEIVEFAVRMETAHIFDKVTGQTLL